MVPKWSNKMIKVEPPFYHWRNIFLYQNLQKFSLSGLNINSKKASTYFWLEARRTLSSFFNKKFYSCRFCLQYVSLQLSIPLSWSVGLCWSLQKLWSDGSDLPLPLIFPYYKLCGPSIIHETRKFNWFSLFSVQSVKLKIYYRITGACKIGIHWL